MNPTDPTPNPVAPGQEPVQAQPVATPEPTPRQAIEARYSQMYQQEPATPPAEPVATPTPEPAAPVDTTQILLDRLAQLEQRLAPPPPPAPVAPPDPNASKNWLEMLSTGDLAAAEAKLRETLKVPDQASVITQAVEQMRAEHEIQTFVSGLQASNTDLLPMEHFINASAQAELARVFTGKPSPSPTEYVAAFKTALNRSVADARKLVLELRGQGATNANTRNSQVLATPTFVPQAATAHRETPPSQETPESPDAYIASRQAWQAKLRGLPANS